MRTAREYKDGTLRDAEGNRPGRRRTSSMLGNFGSIGNVSGKILSRRGLSGLSQALERSNLRSLAAAEYRPAAGLSLALRNISPNYDREIGITSIVFPVAEQDTVYMVSARPAPANTLWLMQIHPDGTGTWKHIAITDLQQYMVSGARSTALVFSRTPTLFPNLGQEIPDDRMSAQLNAQEMKLALEAVITDFPRVPMTTAELKKARAVLATATGLVMDALDWVSMGYDTFVVGRNAYVTLANTAEQIVTGLEQLGNVAEALGATGGALPTKVWSNFLLYTGYWLTNLYRAELWERYSTMFRLYNTYPGQRTIAESTAPGLLALIDANKAAALAAGDNADALQLVRDSVQLMVAQNTASKPGIDQWMGGFEQFAKIDPDAVPFMAGDFEAYLRENAKIIELLESYLPSKSVQLGMLAAGGGTGGKPGEVPHPDPIHIPDALLKGSLPSPIPGPGEGYKAPLRAESPKPLEAASVKTDIVPKSMTPPPEARGFLTRVTKELELILGVSAPAPRTVAERDNRFKQLEEVRKIGKDLYEVLKGYIASAQNSTPYVERAKLELDLEAIRKSSGTDSDAAKSLEAKLASISTVGDFRAAEEILIQIERTLGTPAESVSPRDLVDALAQTIWFSARLSKGDAEHPWTSQGVKPFPAIRSMGEMNIETLFNTLSKFQIATQIDPAAIGDLIRIIIVDKYQGSAESAQGAMGVLDNVMSKWAAHIAELSNEVAKLQTSTDPEAPRRLERLQKDINAKKMLLSGIEASRKGLGPYAIWESAQALIADALTLKAAVQANRGVATDMQVPVARTLARQLRDQLKFAYGPGSIKLDNFNKVTRESKWLRDDTGKSLIKQFEDLLVQVEPMLRELERVGDTQLTSDLALKEGIKSREGEDGIHLKTFLKAGELLEKLPRTENTLIGRQEQIFQSSKLKWYIAEGAKWFFGLGFYAPRKLVRSIDEGNKIYMTAASILGVFLQLVWLSVLSYVPFIGAIIKTAIAPFQKGLGSLGVSVDPVANQPKPGDEPGWLDGFNVWKIAAIGLAVGTVLAPKTVIPAITGVIGDTFSFIKSIFSAAGTKRGPGRPGAPKAAHHGPGRPPNREKAQEELDRAKARQDADAVQKAMSKLRRANP